MDVPVLRIAMAMRMRVSGTVGMYVLMLVEDNLNPASKGVGDAAQGFKAREMVAAFQSSHFEPTRGMPSPLSFPTSRNVRNAPGNPCTSLDSLPNSW